MSASRKKKGNHFDETKDYVGYGSVKLASSLSHTVIATIPPKSTPAGMAIDALLSTFVNPENILSEVERVEYTDEDRSIAGQIKAALAAEPNATHVAVIWPYQTLNLEQPLMGGEGEATFAFTHPMIGGERLSITEGYGVVPEGSAGDTEITAKDVSLYAELDEFVRGPYTRMISLVEFSREDFEEWVATTTEYPKLEGLMKKTLAGKRGFIVNPQGNSFI